MATKGIRTFRPKSDRRRVRVHGFFARVRANAGRILKARRLKGRKRLTVA
ncbi:MAG TPA: 50S ribosomal protein L34 [Patescibacteria group bacterium]